MKKLLAVMLFLVAGQVWAYGELFMLGTTGTRYCSGYKPFRFTPSNSARYFVRLDSDTSVSVFVGNIKAEPDFVSDFDAAFIGNKTLSFDAFYYEDNINHMESVGTIKLDKNGFAKTMNGTFICKGLTDDCYAVGKITGKRIN